MTNPSLLRLAYELSKILLQDYIDQRRKDKAQKEWAETPITFKGCPHCNEINYTPGSTTCRSCGKPLTK